MVALQSTTSKKVTMGFKLSLIIIKECIQNPKKDKLATLIHLSMHKSTILKLVLIKISNIWWFLELKKSLSSILKEETNSNASKLDLRAEKSLLMETISSSQREMTGSKECLNGKKYLSDPKSKLSSIHEASWKIWSPQKNEVPFLIFAHLYVFTIDWKSSTD